MSPLPAVPASDSLLLLAAPHVDVMMTGRPSVSQNFFLHPEREREREIERQRQRERERERERGREAVTEAKTETHTHTDTERA